MACIHFCRPKLIVEVRKRLWRDLWDTVVMRYWTGRIPVKWIFRCLRAFRSEQRYSSPKGEKTYGHDFRIDFIMEIRSPILFPSTNLCLDFLLLSMHDGTGFCFSIHLLLTTWLQHHFRKQADWVAGSSSFLSGFSSTQAFPQIQAYFVTLHLTTKHACVQ